MSPDTTIPDAVSPDPGTAAALPKLQYSGLPTGSRIVAEPTEHGITVKIPPASIIYVIIACGFASLMLMPMTFAIVSIVFNPRHFDFDRLPAVIFIGLVVLTFWPAVIICVWQSIRRRRVPTICTVNDRLLILITPDLPTLRREFPIDADLRISAVSRGINPMLRPAGMLRVQSRGLELDLLRGQDLREIQWIALALNAAIAPKGEP